MSDKKKPDNVVQFPNIRLDNPPLTPKDVKQRLTEYKESYSTELAQIIWENVLGEMDRAGCNFDSNIDKYFPNMILVFESIKALHLLSMDSHHPLHDFARQNTISVPNEDGDLVTGGFKRNIEKPVDIDPEMD